MRFTVVLVCVALCGACTSERSVRVNVADVGAIEEGSAVRVGGVRVGAVSEIGTGSGPLPVVLHVTVEGDHSEVLNQPLCANVSGESLDLDTGDGAAPIENDTIVLCPIDMVDAAREAIEAVQNQLGDLEQALGNAEREAGQRLGEGLREAAGGFVEGVTMGGDTRDLGREIGMEARELAEGLEEGSAPMAPPPANP